MNQETTLVQAAQAEGLLPDAAISVLNDPAPSWVVTALGFVGAQFAVWPFLAVLAAFGAGVFFELPGSLVMAGVLIAGAVAGLRAQAALFVTQLCVTALLVGLGLLAFSLGKAFSSHNLMLALLLIVQVGVALLVRVAWVQRLLGFLAALTWMLLQLGASDHGYDAMRWLFPGVRNAVLLALAWAAWARYEPRLSVQPLARQVAAFADGVGVALLVVALYCSGAAFFGGGAFGGGSRAGSADAALAGTARLFALTPMVALQALLVAAAWLGLVRHWRLLAADKRRELALLSLAYGCWLVFGFFTHDGGVVALVGTAAIATGRKRLALLALAVLLAQLSGFYYALAWPLAQKAALLAGIGALLGLTLVALHWLGRAPLAASSASAAAHPASLPRQPRPAWTLALIFGGAVLALGAANHDVLDKEQVIQSGQKIYVALAPRDPRSLMQGDYMALNFGFPREIETALEQADSGRTQNRAVVVARLDARGVATVLRVASAHETPAAGELLLPLKRMQWRWVLVTDAFYFPEGQGQPLQAARFGEFRVLPDGRALLVGLADEQLQPLKARLASR
ncbi:MAG: GDYXXLXY domain-containing protein [Polaromonas sp.]|nr:GDYXXLXY domain-containing protein [Polaromonas sp.]